MRRAIRGREDGQAMVEFALVLPVLMVLLLGMIQFGLAINNWIEVSSAVRVGARKAAVSKSATDPIQATIDAAKASTSIVDKAKLDVKVTPNPTWKTGDEVTVKIQYPATIRVMGITFFDAKLTGQSKIRVE